MLEIYSEQVRDLLVKDQNVQGGLPVRENQKQGRFFVQGLRRVPVASYEEIERRMSEGTCEWPVHLCWHEVLIGLSLEGTRCSLRWRWGAVWAVAGTANRTVAATKMNATSSRAHTVVTITFETITKAEGGAETTRSSEINLVDLVSGIGGGVVTW